jgi:hypothetical protein
MKEIVLIAAYTPDTVKQDNLRELVKSLKELNYRICLITHTSTPLDIVDRCDYYIYDKENELLYDPDIKYKYFCVLQDYIFRFKDYLAVSTHMLPIFRMYLGGLAYLKSMGEEIIHMIEYDTIVKNRKMWDINNEILKEKDAVFYTTFQQHIDNKEIYVVGPHSVNIKNISYDFLNFNSSELKKQYKEYFNASKFPICERMFFDNIWSKLNYYLFQIEDVKDLSSSFDINLHRLCEGTEESTTIHFFNNKYHFFHNNIYGNNNKNYFEIIINKTYCINVTCDFSWFRWVPLEFDNIENIKIYKNNVFIKELDLTSEEGKQWISYSSVEIK